MSNSRKLKSRTVPRTPRYPHNKHAEPIPFANRFQELIEQDERSPSPTSKLPGPQLGTSTSPPTRTMAQRLQNLLEESDSKNKGSASLVEEDIQRNSNFAGGAEILRNDECETVDSDTSDHEGWTKCSPKVVLPMGLRLHELLQQDASGSIQKNSKLRQKGKKPIESDLELRFAFREDDIEAYENVQTATLTSLPGVAKPQLPLPRISEQFQEALMAAPSFDFSPFPSVQFPVDQDYSTRLQRIIQLEKQQYAEISKGLPLDTSLESLQVEVTKKSLEGRLTTCKCRVLQAPSKWMEPSLASSTVDEVQVIFNSKVAAELEIDVGCKVQINPPWREVTILGSTARVILCTYFCELVC